MKIEDGIRQRKLVKGQKLPTEKVLCESFGVSRTALREALRSLSARGLVTIRKGDGIYVNDFSHSHANKPMSIYLELKFDRKYAIHLVQVRQMMEPQIAMMAARNRTDEDIRAFETNLAAFNAAEVDSALIANLDLEFHKQISRACANPLIPVIMDPVLGMMPRIKTLIVSRLKHTNSENAVNYHQVIFDHIKAQDEQGAFNAMTQHLKIAENDARKLIDTLADDEELF
ncbi:FadR family transcriptional regulator [candidate division KSB1 bacterium]|nr:FadR family transcriptional regulator [candidate division KSB1 bacterium]